MRKTGKCLKCNEYEECVCLEDMNKAWNVLSREQQQTKIKYLLQSLTHLERCVLGVLKGHTK